MRGDGLGLAGTLEHEELGEDGDGLEEDGKGPEDFANREFVVEVQAEEEARSDEVLDFERIDGGIVSLPGDRR